MLTGLKSISNLLLNLLDLNLETFVFLLLLAFTGGYASLASKSIKEGLKACKYSKYIKKVTGLFAKYILDVIAKETINTYNK